MARILHVDELHGWHETVRDALPDHRVDVVGSSEEARRLLGEGGAYHVALVDLRIVADLEIAGAGLLGLLCCQYPDTAVVVVASAAPSDAARDELARRFGVEEVVIPTGITVPDLRHTIEKALSHSVPVDNPVRRAELHRRNQEWRRRLGTELDARVRAAEMVARNADGTGDDFRRRARTALADARGLRERFRADSAAVTDRIARAVSIQDLLDAADAFEAAAGRYAELVGP
jgi:hypothetical protein